MIYDVYDNVLEPHVAELIDAQVRQCEWHWPSMSNKHHFPTKHWVIPIGASVEEVIKNGYEWILPIWNAAKVKYNFEDKYGVQDFVRLYMNAHTHGIEPHLHTDDGDFTMIYYPRIDWKVEWGGGTLVDGQLVPYVGNSLVVFDAHLPHMAMPVSRQCYELRTCVVFKCYTKNV